MSEALNKHIQSLTTEGLIDFALEHSGPGHDALRQAALQEHALRTKADPKTQLAPAGDIHLLRAKVSQLCPPTSPT